jgi:hypothetical protein
MECKVAYCICKNKSETTADDILESDTGKLRNFNNAANKVQTTCHKNINIRIKPTYDSHSVLDRRQHVKFSFREGRYESTPGRSQLLLRFECQKVVIRYSLGCQVLSFRSVVDLATIAAI